MVGLAPVIGAPALKGTNLRGPKNPIFGEKKIPPFKVCKKILQDSSWGKICELLIFLVKKHNIGCFWGQITIFSRLTPFYEARTGWVSRKSISLSNFGLIGTLHWPLWPILAVFRGFLGSNGHFFKIDPLLWGQNWMSQPKSISLSNFGLIGTLLWLQWPILAVFRVF